MWQHNDGAGESNVLQNQFTSLLVKAIKNKKVDYLRQKTKQRKHEIQVEDGEQGHFHSDFDINQILPAIEQLESVELQQSLQSKTKRALYIFMAKVLEDRSFAEIASELGMKYSAVSESYYRTVRLIKKELGVDDR